jgi:hypothetical protein
MSDDDLEISDHEPPTPEGIGNAADPADQRVRRERKQEVELAGDAVWRQLLSSPAGRFEVWNFLQINHFSTVVFAIGPGAGFPQPESTWFQAGQRETALALYRSLCRISWELIGVMHTECDPAYPKLHKPRGRRK